MGVKYFPGLLSGVFNNPIVALVDGGVSESAARNAVGKAEESGSITVLIDDQKGVCLTRRDDTWERWDVRTGTLYDTSGEAVQAGCYRWRQPVGSPLVSAFLWMGQASP